LKKRALIIGGGFIGSCLARKLLEDDIEVTIFDIVTSIVENPSLSYWDKYVYFFKLRYFDIFSKVSFVRGDVRNKYDLLDAIRKINPSTIYFLVALPQARQNSNFSDEAFDICVGGLHNVLESLKFFGVNSKLVFSSSSFVYGNFPKDGIAQEDSPTNPVDVYGAHKLAAESMIRGYGERFGLSWIIMRPIAVYGPGDIPGNRVVATFIDAAIQNEALMVNGNGEERLSFTYVGDVADGFKMIGESEEKNEIFNISSGLTYSINELIDVMKRFFPRARVEYANVEKHRPKRGLLGISKIKSRGFEPVVSFQDGIDREIQTIVSGRMIL